MKTMKIEFSDRKYMYEHGKAPKGYGQWFFTFEGYSQWVCGTLAEAKRRCREYVKKVAPKDYVGTVLVTIEP